MSFATLRQLRYAVLILNRADMAASQRYVVENGINAFKGFLPIQDILATYCTKVPSVKRC